MGNAHLSPDECELLVVLVVARDVDRRRRDFWAIFLTTQFPNLGKLAESP